MNRCLKFTTKSLTWFEAREFCRSFNADLATINSLDAVKTISEKTEIGGQYWVGLHRISWQNKDNRGTGISISIKPVSLDLVFLCKLQL